MGKKAKKMKQNEKRITDMMSHMEDTCKKTNRDVTINFTNNLYRVADRVRTIAPTSQRLNEISETLDSLLVQALDLTADEVAVLQRIW